jgi:hypothetical protein
MIRDCIFNALKSEKVSLSSAVFERKRQAKRAEQEDGEVWLKEMPGWGVVVFAHNPSYLGGGGRRIMVQGAPRQNISLI